MADRERTTSSLISADAVVLYCTWFAQTKGTHKDKCESARNHLLIEFPGVTKDVIADIERIALVALDGTITRW